MMSSVTQFIQDEEGATALEYGLLAALIAAVIVTAVSSLGQKVASTFSFINSKMPTVSGS